MPWRLIMVIAVFVVLLVFIMFNLGEDYTSNINFGFKEFESVPVFLTIFLSFLLGILFTLPFVIFAGIKRKNVPVKEIKIDKKYLFPRRDTPKDTAVKNDDKPVDGGVKK